jgi:mRNA interferase MazF
MGKFVKGEIVVAPFPFSDLNISKRRPAAILADLPGDDLMLSQIASKKHSDDLSVILKTEDIVGGYLS